MFHELGIDQWLIDQLAKISIKKPTEIQLNTIKPILEGRDIIASARTGSGKTLAFCLPILQKLAMDPYGIYALVLTPTRELAFQIAEQCRIVGATIGLKVAVVVGGMDMTQQNLELAQRPHIVIATPGRLVDHIQSSQLTFKRLKFLVLDEADRLLDNTFTQDLETILGNLPSKRQTLLFSATMTEEIENLEFKSQKPYVYSCARFDTNESCEQKYLFIPSTVREVYLSYLLLNDLEKKTVIIFASKPRTCEILRIMLKEQGVRSTCLHSHMSQNDRLGSLAKFKGGIVPILICTDVGSRGLDIPQVQVVINYQLPADPTDYIHRIGRTARAGRGGLSISVVTERDVEIVKTIESKTSTIALS
jgi:ATP-dependent RNA helicase DDX49/DBP8